MISNRSSTGRPLEKCQEVVILQAKKSLKKGIGFLKVRMLHNMKQIKHIVCNGCVLKTIKCRGQMITVDVFLDTEHHDESSGVRHVRRMFHPGRGLGGPRARRSNMHFTSSSTGGLSTSQSSSQSSNYSREAMDPIAGQ